MFDRVINASLMTIFARTAQKMKFSIKDFFSKFDQIRSFLRIWSYLLKKSLIEILNMGQSRIDNPFT